MSVRRDTPFRLPPVLAMVLAAVLALAVVPAVEAQGQASPAPASPARALAQSVAGTEKDAAKTAPGVSIAELESLARTLENDAEREKLLADLNALIALRKAEKTGRAAKPREGLSDRITRNVSEKLQALGTRFAEVLGVVERTPRLAGWLEEQVTVERKRERLVGLIWRFVVIVGLGMAVQYAFRRLTAGFRRRVETDVPDPLGGRIVRFALRTILLFANAFSYALGAYGAFALLRMAPPADQVLLVGASAFFVAKLILASTRVVVAPGVAGLRLVPVGDETAHYLYIWVRRLVRIFVYAFFLLEATRVVGLPEPAYNSLLYLLGLAFVAFLVVFVLQNRRPVAEAIRGAGGGSIYGGLRARLASTWHLFAFLYIGAVYLVWLFRVEGGFEFLMVATAWTAVIVVLAKLVIVGVVRGMDRVFRVSPELDRRYPGLQARANRYLPLLNGLMRWIVYLVASLFAFDVWGVDTLGWLTSRDGALFLNKVVTIAIIVIVAIAIWEALSLLIGRQIDRLDEAGKGTSRVRTLLPLMRTGMLIVIGVLVSLIILAELGVNIGPLLAGAGVIGLAIGFGSQKLVQDVITGLFILIEDTLAVGDVVQFDATHAGIVEALSIRSVRLRDLQGAVHTLPFSEVRTVLNMTKDYAFYMFEVGVAYRENVDRVIEVLREIAEEMRADDRYGQFIVEPLEVLGLDRFADSAVIIRVRLKIQPPINKWMVGREFNRRMKARFDAEGIEIPFPHRTLYFGEDREGRAPPAQVRVVEESGGAGAPGGERG